MNFAPGWFPGLVMAAEKLASVQYVSFGMSASNPQTSYSFTGRNLGPESPTRTMIILMEWNPMTSGSFGNCRIDGNNMNLRSSYGLTSGPRLYTFPWPTGSTATIQTTVASGNFMYCHWAMWAAYDLKSEVPTDTYYDLTLTNPYSSNVDVLAGGIALGLSFGLASGGYTWTGITEDLDTTGGVSNADRLSAASLAFKNAQTPLNVTTTKSQNHRHALASFR